MFGVGVNCRNGEILGFFLQCILFLVGKVFTMGKSTILKTFHVRRRRCVDVLGHRGRAQHRVNFVGVEHGAASVACCRYRRLKSPMRTTGRAFALAQKSLQLILHLGDALTSGY